tara:strand:+ start:371 stop:613 length:243 start_codon:yes stop_codon:yes gene_type:complete
MSIKYFCDDCKKEIKFSSKIRYDYEGHDCGVTYFPEGTISENRYDCDNPIVDHSCKKCFILTNCWNEEEAEQHFKEVSNE